MITTLDKNAENWELIYSQKKAGNFLMYPSEHLVTLFFQHKSSINLNGNCLDFGFGSANNTEFLIQQMSTLYGIDVAQSSVPNARKRLGKYANFNPSHFSAADTTDGFSDNFFDLIVAWQMLYYNDKDNVISTIAKLHDQLKSGGILICTLITNDDVKVKYAKQVAEDMYQIDARIPHQEGCRVFSPRNKEDFLALFPAFDVIDAGYYERRSFLADNAASEYYLVARKR